MNDCDGARDHEGDCGTGLYLCFVNNYGGNCGDVDAGVDGGDTFRDVGKSGDPRQTSTMVVEGRTRRQQWRDDECDGTSVGRGLKRGQSRRGCARPLRRTR